MFSDLISVRLVIILVMTLLVGSSLAVAVTKLL